jgi:hypothetical protein
MSGFMLHAVVNRLLPTAGLTGLFFVVAHPAWLGRAVLVFWTLTLVVVVAELRASRLREAVERQEMEETWRLNTRAAEAMAQARRIMSETAVRELAALPRAEWERLAALLPPEMLAAAAPRVEAERFKRAAAADPAWDPLRQAQEEYNREMAEALRRRA